MVKQTLVTETKDTSAGGPRRGSNQSGLRASNERLVLSIIREAGAMAKAEIARRTGLSAQTVSVIMRGLEADGLLERGTPVRGKIGQPSIPMNLARTGAFFFGLKVGRRSLDLVLTDFLGVVHHRVRVSHLYPTPEDTHRFAAGAIEKILIALPPEHQARIAGFGIALPFQLWDWAEALGVDQADMTGWKDFDLASQIGASWDFPVFTCNDASAACGAELVFGTQAKPRNFLYVFVGFFIGGGLVLDGRLFTGPMGNAAALGSMRVQAPDGTMRQLVDVASLAALENAVAAQTEKDGMNWEAPEGWDLPRGSLEVWLRAASEGIAQAILASVCLVDVGHVVIEGWMPAPMRKELVARVQEQLSELSAAGVQKPAVTEGSIGPDARALGAASLPLSKRFLIDGSSFGMGHAS